MLGLHAYEGDSLMLGSHCVANNAFLTVQKSFPNFASSNMAIGGQTMAQITAAGPFRIDSALPVITGIKRLIIWGGGNDIDLDLSSSCGDTILYNQVKRVYAARAAGFNQITIGTITPRASPNPNFESVRQYIRERQLAGITGADKIADIGGDLQIGAPNAYLNRLFYCDDNVHLIDAGSIIAGNIIVKVIQS